MHDIITRFAPSPTGLLHVGSVRPALVNYLFAKRHHGKFVLRIDDTDLVRSTDYFKQQILHDLRWLGLEWDEIFFQSDRLDRYKQVVDNLLAAKRLYECFETPEELDIKRKIQLSNSKPPIYDRTALNLTAEQKQNYINQGRVAHYRFKLEDGEIAWDDLIRGHVKYQACDISDPIVIRADGSFTYMLCSAIDDFDYKISHIFRGEDHINNTAIQLQMFEAMNAPIPQLGHLSFLKAKDEKISKRVGGFEVKSLAEDGIEPMAINSFFAYIGTAKPMLPRKKMSDLIEDFDVKDFSSSPTIYNPDDLVLLNHKLLIQLNYDDVKEDLHHMGINQIDEEFWLAIRANLSNLREVKFWWEICKNPLAKIENEQDLAFLKTAFELLPSGEFDHSTWQNWTQQISATTGKKGRELFMPLRIALTGLDYGPEMKLLLALIGRQEVIKRLKIW
jgi:glutamyl-tRNA synthetase